MTHLAVPTLRSIGALLRDEWHDRGLGPSREFDLSVMRLLESGYDWRALGPGSRLALLGSGNATHRRPDIRSRFSNDGARS